MEKANTFLIIEDHPQISNSYMSAMECVTARNKSLKFNKKGIAKNCDEAYELIHILSKSGGVDLIFLDIHLPPSKNHKILSGEDLGLLIRNVLPKSKIIVSTMYNDNYRIYNIYKSISPEGFLVKNDLNEDVLVDAIEKSIKFPPYHSHSVRSSIGRQMPNLKMIDEFDRKLLYELSRGAKMKNLPNLIPMSLPGIEKRKRHLKILFNVQDLDDRSLIQEAKDRGFI